MAEDDDRNPLVRVRDVMAVAPVTVSPSEPLGNVVRLMTSRRIGAVLVTEDDRLAGIFTERDLLRHAAEANPTWREQPVSDWMTRRLHTISADAGWENAMALMEEKHVRHLPVLDGERLAGIVAARNLIAWRAEHLDRLVAVRTQKLHETTAQLLERDRQAQRNMAAAGRLMNRLLLPKSPPDWPEWNWAVHFSPLDPLGGDYYDFAHPDSQHVGVLIADASGHSVPAAMVAIMARIAFAEVSRSPRPADVLAAMNRRLQGLADERFVTAFYGVFDRESGTFRFANAGHPQPLHYSAAERSCRPLSASGFMLGIVPDWDYEEQSIVLGAGDRLCFYTDGAIDSRNPASESFGMDRLEGLLAAHAMENAESLRRSIVGAIKDFRGDQLAHDDCTLLIAAHK